MQSRLLTIFSRLKAAAADDWAGYVDHEFVRQLGDGTLPEAAFRMYLVQDYLFLIQFARDLCCSPPTRAARSPT